MSWNDSTIKQAKKIIKMYPQKRSPIGPLLHLAQSKDGNITDDSIAVISELVGITEVQVKSVSTFYSMYKQEPTGKYLLSVCKSISCEINNSKENSVQQKTVPSCYAQSMRKIFLNHCFFILTISE